MSFLSTPLLSLSSILSAVSASSNNSNWARVYYYNLLCVRLCSVFTLSTMLSPIKSERCAPFFDMKPDTDVNVSFGLTAMNSGAAVVVVHILFVSMVGFCRSVVDNVDKQLSRWWFLFRYFRLLGLWEQMNHQHKSFAVYTNCKTDSNGAAIVLSQCQAKPNVSRK